MEFWFAQMILENRLAYNDEAIVKAALTVLEAPALTTEYERLASIARYELDRRH
jgi:hypothetical protein